MKKGIIINDVSYPFGKTIAAGLRRTGIYPICCSYKKGVFERCIERNKPDAALILVFDVNRECIRIAELKKKYPDMYIFTGVFRSGKIVHRELLRAGVDFSFPMPINEQYVYERILDIMFAEKKIMYDEAVGNYLIKCGFQPDLLGFRYLTAAIKICIDEPSLLSGKICGIYKIIGEKCRTKPELAERSVRTAAEKALSSGCIPFAFEKKPSNGELLCVLCDNFVQRYK
ncbi:MAG: sporulation initiation factor Spo0A C-terminal domain-containing protein [Ruminococcus sp.]|nr:sporulation initiation factor Spo0A C-terminal domain-containing protein [Ruminococcus sp.]